MPPVDDKIVIRFPVYFVIGPIRDVLSNFQDILSQRGRGELKREKSTLTLALTLPLDRPDSEDEGKRDRYENRGWELEEQLQKIDCRILVELKIAEFPALPLPPLSRV